MSLGFEVEINVEVNPPDAATFQVCAVIETGTIAVMTRSTVELVSEVDKDPYVDEPRWRKQVSQIVTLMENLWRTNAGTTVRDFVTARQHYRFDSDLTESQIVERLGAEPAPWWTYVVCCVPPSDSRIAGIESAELARIKELKPIDEGHVQINFSTNLAYLGKKVIAGVHPFQRLVGEAHLDVESRVMDAFSSPSFLQGLFGRRAPEISERLIGFLYLIAHRIASEGHPLAPVKNRFYSCLASSC